LVPSPHTWAQIGGDMDKDDGPLGPYSSIGFAEADGVFYATQQRSWGRNTNSDFTGLVGVASSTDHARPGALPASRSRHRSGTAVSLPLLLLAGSARAMRRLRRRSPE
jgi:hypothetical protein